MTGRRGGPLLLVLGVLALVAASGPATAFHSGASACSYLDGTVRVKLAPEHVVRLLVVDNEIHYADLTDSSRKGRCGTARVGNTDLIIVTEAVAGASRLQFDEQIGRFGPGRTLEPKGVSEIEVRLGTLRDLWVMGRPRAQRVTIGTRGVNLNDDHDVDLIGTELREVNVFLGAGDDRFSAGGGRGTGQAWRYRHLAVSGSDGADVLLGSPRADILSGDAGADVIRGGAGSDDIAGGGHGDLLYGGYGKDIIGAEGGADRVRAGPGDDLITANDNVEDILHGGDGADRAFVDTLDRTADIESTTFGNP